jgi:hypothetical protein
MLQMRAHLHFYFQRVVGSLPVGIIPVNQVNAAIPRVFWFRNVVIALGERVLDFAIKIILQDLGRRGN